MGDERAAYDAYVEAAMVACPRCRVAVGKPCVESWCKNGYRNCQYAICAIWVETERPHLERAVKARQAIAEFAERAAQALAETFTDRVTWDDGHEFIDTEVALRIVRDLAGGAR